MFLRSRETRSRTYQFVNFPSLGSFVTYYEFI